MVGTAGADLGNPGGKGRAIPGGNLMLAATPPASPPPIFEFIFMLIFMFIADGGPIPVGLGPEGPEPMGDDLPAIPIRCCWRARALCIMSRGKPFALGGGLRALLSMPVTVDEGFMVLAFCGSDTVRKDGTLRGYSLMGEKLGDASELELGASSGVLASEELGDPGEVGWFSENSSGVSGPEWSL